MPSKTDPPLCTTLAECTAHDGEVVRVEGIYSVWDPLPMRWEGDPPAQQVQLVFDAGEEGPFLGAWGYDDHFRALEEIARFQGKQVRVIGKFLRRMPPHPTDPPEAASLDGPCVHPIETIALAH